VAPPHPAKGRAAPAKGLAAAAVPLADPRPLSNCGVRPARAGAAIERAQRETRKRALKTCNVTAPLSPPSRLPANRSLDRACAIQAAGAETQETGAAPIEGRDRPARGLKVKAPVQRLGAAGWRWPLADRRRSPEAPPPLALYGKRDATDPSGRSPPRGGELQGNWNSSLAQGLQFSLAIALGEGVHSHRSTAPSMNTFGQTGPLALGLDHQWGMSRLRNRRSAPPRKRAARGARCDVTRGSRLSLNEGRAGKVLGLVTWAMAGASAGTVRAGHQQRPPLALPGCQAPVGRPTPGTPVIGEASGANARLAGPRCPAGDDFPALPGARWEQLCGH